MGREFNKVFSGWTVVILSLPPTAPGINVRQVSGVLPLELAIEFIGPYPDTIQSCIHRIVGASPSEQINYSPAPYYSKGPRLEPPYLPFLSLLARRAGPYETWATCCTSIDIYCFQPAVHPYNLPPEDLPVLTSIRVPGRILLLTLNKPSCFSSPYYFISCI